MDSIGLTVADADAFLDKVQVFDDGSRYERLEPMTNFRKDDGVARILYLCRREPDNASKTVQNEMFVMKVKVQVPSINVKEPVEGPNTETAAELHALETFAKKERKSVPQLVTWKKLAQGKNGLLPGGYLIITVMTLMPGKSLLDLSFWSLASDVQESIRAAFMVTLKDIWLDGFIPYDRGLRNILWNGDTGQCSIIDFEYYNPRQDSVQMNEKEEMELWGVMRRPALDWYSEWAVSAPPKKKAR
ncbi:hypothetical protein VTL71DRAFT_2875 [Oculimacula yallundae]|uniref:Uncharacterized protein n=1 Tax=Oculimacula yallundae TaxID=86028 RepID=A0ABR4C7B5_9HELO